MKKQTPKEYVVNFQYTKRVHNFGHIAVTATSETEARKKVRDLFELNRLDDYVFTRITDSVRFGGGRLIMNKPQRLDRAY